MISPQKAMSTFQDEVQKNLPHLSALNSVPWWTDTDFLASKSKGERIIALPMSKYQAQGGMPCNLQTKSTSKKQTSKIRGGEMNVVCTRVTVRHMTHSIPASWKSAEVKEAYTVLNLSLFENTGRKIPKTCFAFLTFNLI